MQGLSTYLKEGKISTHGRLSCRNYYAETWRPWHIVIASRAPSADDKKRFYRREVLKDKRRLINEDEIMHVLQNELRNTLVSRHTFGHTNDVEIARDADILIGYHGRNLVNFVYMRRGSIVVEIQPAGFQSLQYAAETKMLQLHYGAYVNLNRSRQETHLRNNHDSHITANPFDILRVLRTVTSMYASAK